MNGRRTQDGKMFILQLTNEVVNQEGRRFKTAGHPSKRIT
jgi:hypothetical protein